MNYITTRTLGEGITLISGQHVNASEVSNTTSEIPYLTGPADFRGTKPFATKWTSKGTAFCEVGDILITVKGSGVGSIALADKRYAISRQLMAIRCDKFNPNFIWLILEQQIDKLRTQASGVIPGLSRNDILNIAVPSFPDEIQKNVGNLLIKWENAIEIYEKLINLKRSLKQGLMQQLLTGKRRFPEFKKSLWQEYCLGELTEITMGTSPSSNFYNNVGEGIPLVQGMSDISNGYESPRFWTTVVTQTAKAGDILLSVRAPVGAIARTKQKICVGRGVAAIRAKEELSQDFLYQMLIFIESKWQQFARGSTFESITSKDVINFKILIPSSYLEQIKIANLLSNFDVDISLTKHQLILLQMQKRGLMQKLLTGEIQVPISDENAA